jgi:hypothetical protein
MNRKHILFTGEAVVVLMATALSSVLLLQHLHILTEVQAVSVPLLASIQNLEQKQSIIEGQLQLTQRKINDRNVLATEKVQLFILDETTAYERGVAALSTWLHSAIEQNKATERSALRTQITPKGTTMQFSVDVQSDALEDLHTLVAISGMYSVYDALSTKQRSDLVLLTEQESPEAITELEDFFATPLLSFASEHQAYVQGLLRSFSGTQFAAVLQSIIETSALRSVIDVYESPIGTELLTKSVWPYPVLTLQSYDQIQSAVKDWQTVTVTIILRSF